MLQDISFISDCSPSLSTSAPPLTLDNVLTVVQGVHWARLGARLLFKTHGDNGTLSKLKEIESQHQSDADRLHAVVKTWMQSCGKDQEPSWRHIIWSWDQSCNLGNKAKVPDNIRHFAEPVLGRSYVYPHSCTMYKYFLTR